MTTLATDDFNRANGGLGANWTTTTSETAPAIVSNQVNPGGAQFADHGARYSGATWPADQWAQFKGVAVANSGSGIGVALRSASAAQTHYLCNLEDSITAPNLVRAKYVAGVFTLIASEAVTFAANDTFYAEIQGTTIICKRNGSAFGTNQTDASIGTGSAGIFHFYAGSSTNSALDDWVGGDFAAGGSFPPVPESLHTKSQINALLVN